MNHIYIPDYSKKAFDKYITKQLLNYTNEITYPNQDVILMKKNVKIEKCLTNLTRLAPDIIKLICTYIDDVCTTECSINFFTDHSPIAEVWISLAIKLVDVQINFEKYSSNYDFNIMFNRETVNMSHYELNLRENDNNNIFETIKHDNSINGLLALFDSYMEYEYMFNHKKYTYDRLESYSYVKTNKNTLVRSRNCRQTIVKIRNHKKMKHIIVILKVIIKVMLRNFSKHVHGELPRRIIRYFYNNVYDRN